MADIRQQFAELMVELVWWVSLCSQSKTYQFYQKYSYRINNVFLTPKIF